MLPGLHFLTHIGLSWILASLRPLAARDRAIVVLAGVVPDLDGIGILWSEHAYAVAHRAVGHGVVVGALVVIAAIWLGTSPGITAALAAASFHLHLLLDLVGTGGAPIRYFWPLSEHGWSYDGHWVLASWPNVAVMVATAVGVLLVAARRRRATLRAIA